MWETNSECCMCGDFGLSHQLVRCKACRFRSQHRYCSNLYPKADSYDTCNWCLMNRNFETKERSRSSSSTSSFCTNVKDVNITGNNNMVGKTNTKIKDKRRDYEGLVVKRSKRASSDALRVNEQKSSPERARETRKRVMTRGQLEEISKIRMAKSENTSKIRSTRGMLKKGFRNRVKKYKLLDEVSN